MRPDVVGVFVPKNIQESIVAMEELKEPKKDFLPS